MNLIRPSSAGDAPIRHIRHRQTNTARASRHRTHRHHYRTAMDCRHHKHTRTHVATQGFSGLGEKEGERAPRQKADAPPGSRTRTGYTTALTPKHEGTRARCRPSTYPPEQRTGESRTSRQLDRTAVHVLYGSHGTVVYRKSWRGRGSDITTWYRTRFSYRDREPCACRERSVPVPFNKVHRMSAEDM